MKNSKITLWRGVCKEHPGFQKAMRGIAEPRGGHDDPQLHNDGDTKSIFTSWTRDRKIAEIYAKSSGIILEKDFPTPSDRFGSYNEDKFYEEEVLVTGIIENAKVYVV